MSAELTPTTIMEKIIASIKEIKERFYSEVAVIYVTKKRFYSEVSVIYVAKNKKIVELEELTDMVSTTQERHTQLTSNTRAIIEDLSTL